MRDLIFCAGMTVFFLLSVCFLTREGRPSVSEEKKLTDRYPWSSIYISYIPLNDMTNALNSDDNFNKLVKLPPGEEVLRKFKGFLNQIKEQRMSEAVAFLQLNLVTGKAGYKKLSDRDGVIHVVPWEREEVEGIAEFSDRSLNRLLDYEKTHNAIASGVKEMTLTKAWKTSEGLIADPHIPPEKIAPLMKSVRQLIDQRPDEWKELKKQKNLFDKINKFKIDYDTSLQQIQERIGKEEGLEDLLNRRVTLPGDLKKVGDLDREWNEMIIKIAPLPEKSEPRTTQPPRPLHNLIDPKGPSVVPKQGHRKE